MKNLLVKRVKKNNKGFTLVELIIVIAIIAILVAVLAPNYVKYVEESRWSADQNTSKELLSEVKTALVAAQEDSSYSAKDFTIEMSSTETTCTITDPKDAFLKALNEADKDWSKGVVKHKQAHKKDGSITKDGVDSVVDSTDKYFINYSSADEKVTAGWGADKDKLK